MSSKKKPEKPETSGGTSSSDPSMSMKSSVPVKSESCPPSEDSGIFDSEDQYREKTIFEIPGQRKVYHFLLMGAATIIIIAGIKAASGIVAPLLLALFLTIILLVPLRWLREKGCPNILALLIVLGCTFTIFIGVGMFVGSSLNSFIKEIPAYQKQIVRKFDSLKKELKQYGFSLGEEEPVEENPSPKIPPAESKPREEDPKSEIILPPQPLVETLPDSDKPGEPFDHETSTEGQIAQSEPKENDDAIDPEADYYIDHLAQEMRAEGPPLVALDIKSVMYWVSKSMLELKHLAESGFLVMIFTLFMIFEAAMFPHKVDRAFGKNAPIGNVHFQNIANEIRRYLFLKAISSLMSALAATMVYLLFGVPAALFWGVVAFFLYFIPNIGGIVASIIPGLLIFMTYDIQGVLLYAVCLITIECTIGYGIEPKMLGHGLGISTVVILISLFTWGWILGPVGFFLAAPLTIMVKIILQAFKETEWIAILIGNKPRG